MHPQVFTNRHWTTHRGKCIAYLCIPYIYINIFFSINEQNVFVFYSNKIKGNKDHLTEFEVASSPPGSVMNFDVVFLYYSSQTPHYASVPTKNLFAVAKHLLFKKGFLPCQAIQLKRGRCYNRSRELCFQANHHDSKKKLGWEDIKNVKSIIQMANYFKDNCFGFSTEKPPLEFSDY